MILTCPQCSKQFRLPASALGAEGRDVKCTGCEEVWFQKSDESEVVKQAPPVEEEIQVDDVMDDSPSFSDMITDDEEREAFSEDEDIPDAVKPILDEMIPELAFVDAPPALSGLKKLNPFKGEVISLQSRLGGYVAAAVVFFALVLVLSVLKTPVVKAWPASAGLYKILGMSVPLPGEGLIFDQISARVDSDGKTLILEGEIVNLLRRDQALPMVLAQVRSESGDSVAKWIIELPKSKVPAEKVLAFSSHYEIQEGADIEDVQLRFVLSAHDAHAPVLSNDGAGHDVKQHDAAHH